MRWVKETEYNIRSGEYSIAKCFVEGCTLYVLYKKKEINGYFECADDARSKAKELENECV